jgi:hypothetical protein
MGQFESIIIINELISIYSGSDPDEAAALKQRKLRILKMSNQFFYALALAGLLAIWLVILVNETKFGTVSSGIFSAYFFFVFVTLVLNTLLMNRVMKHEYFREQSHRARYNL